MAVQRSRAAQHHSGLAAQARRTPNTAGTEALAQSDGADGSYNRYVARIRVVSNAAKFLDNPRQATGSGKDDASLPGIDRRSGAAISGRATVAIGEPPLGRWWTGARGAGLHSNTESETSPLQEGSVR